MNDRDSLSHLLAVGLEPGAELGQLDFSDIPDGLWRVGGYELLEQIGQGGMGIIYRARQPYSNRIVALKRLKPLRDGDTETAQRLHREAQTVASLDHPHILPIYEVGTGEDGLPFFSMKLAVNGSLATYRNLPVRKACELLAKVARAVQYAHGQGILHRDLKPGNILLDAKGEPLVADFGLAKWLDLPSDLTQSLTVFGTPGYLAPEQAIGSKKTMGKTADIYSLGAILFELLSGRPPFVGDNAWAVVREAADTSAPLLRTLNPIADLDLETICSRCLEREPSARYQNAGDIADDLQRWLDGRPIIARPISPAERGWRWVMRNRILAGTSLLCLLLATSTALWLVQKQRLESQLRLQNLANNAVVMLPILDLDEVKSDSAIGKKSTDTLLSTLTQAGRQIKPFSGDNGWAKNFADQAKASGAPYLIVGTTRQMPDGRRYALHSFDARQGRLTRRVIGTTQDDPAIFLRYLTNELLAGRGEIVIESSAEYVAANPEARDLIASGTAYYERSTVESLDQAISCGRKAVIADPQSARAYALIALALTRRSWFGSENQTDSQKQAEIAVEKAIALAPDSPKVCLARAHVAFAAGRLAEAEKYICTYLESSMNMGDTAYMRGCIAKLYGRSDLALAWFRLSRAFVPGGKTLNLEADVLSDLGMDAEATTAYQTFANLFPDRSDGRLGLCELKILDGQFPEARKLAEELARDFPSQTYPRLIAAQEAFYARDYPRAAALYGKLLEEDRAGGAFFYGSISFLSGKGFSLLAMGKTEEGLNLLREAQKNDSLAFQNERSQLDVLNSLAANEAALGNHSVALKILQENLPIMSTTHRFIARDPRFDTLRGNPVFQTILRTMAERIESLKWHVAATDAHSK